MDVRSSNLSPYCHISLPYITKFVINEVNPHPRIVLGVNMWSATLLLIILLLLLCHLLNVGACVQHIAQEGQVEWTTLA
jgi:hypothetical protein